MRKARITSASRRGRGQAAWHEVLASRASMLAVSLLLGDEQTSREAIKPIAKFWDLICSEIVDPASQRVDHEGGVISCIDANSIGAIASVDRRRSLHRRRSRTCKLGVELLVGLSGKEDEASSSRLKLRKGENKYAKPYPRIGTGWSRFLIRFLPRRTSFE